MLRVTGPFSGINIIMTTCMCSHDYLYVLLYSGKVWRTDSFQVFGQRKFDKLIDQPKVISCKHMV